MGRYYSGDIEGKFAFGIQSSDDAEFFGLEGSEPSEINYYADEEALPDIKAGLEDCLKHLGENKGKLDKFFGEHDGYNDERIATAIGVKQSEVNDLLAWYFRYDLGKKIYDHTKEHGTCEFTAEL